MKVSITTRCRPIDNINDSTVEFGIESCVVSNTHDCEVAMSCPAPGGPIAFIRYVKSAQVGTPVWWSLEVAVDVEG